MTLRGATAIVGVAESRLGRVPGTSPLELQAEAAHAALAEAGLELRDVDGLFSAFHLGSAHMPTVVLAEYLGIQPSYSDSTIIGGSSFQAHVAHAAAAIHAGLCTTALITYGSTQRSDRSRDLFGIWGGKDPAREFEGPHGLPLQIGAYALVAARHMARYGTSREDLARVAVSARAWAQRNPAAYRREPLTLDDVLASDPICDPLSRYDCCLITDGGGAVVVTSLERARDLRTTPVEVLGVAERHTHFSVSQMPDLTTTAARETGRAALAMAGLDIADIDLAQIYDSFTITVLVALEDLGFCAKGEAGAWFAANGTGPEARLPVNTSGGGLSYCHPGMFGLLLIVEAVRQLRREAGERQVARTRTALVHGIGGSLSSHATLVLGRGVA
jgi:acetyl-CoA acetyltransferase